MFYNQASLDLSILHNAQILYKKCTIYGTFVKLFKFIYSIYLTNNH